MTIDRTYFVDQSDIDSILQNSDNFVDIYSSNLNVHFKPFTTLTSATGVAHYNLSVFASGSSLVPNSYTFQGADTSGLNPFGRYTLGEGIMYGATPSADMDIAIDPNFVRTLGLKTPHSYVGWGFDIFGYPAPNFSSGWSDLAYFGTTSPSANFLGAGGSGVVHGRDVPEGNWRAGPVDLRWDNLRKVWRSPQSVYSAYIIARYSGTTPITNDDDRYPPSVLRYDAIIYDGTANRIRVTGISPQGPRSSEFNVKPFSSGDFCFIIHANVSNKPTFSIYGREDPGIVNCTTSSNIEALGASNVLALAESYLTFDGLEISALGEEYGGTGSAVYSSGQILIADPSGGSNASLLKRVVSAGSGMNITMTPTQLVFSFSTGVAFTAGGINNTITELQGLTTPLSLAQGGTGASGKNFVDLTTSQLVGGLKNFASGISVGSGLVSRPSIAFNNDTNTGFYSGPSGGIYLASSGQNIVKFDFNQCYSNLPLVIAPTFPTYLNKQPSLEVRESTFYSGVVHIQRWSRGDSTILSYLSNEGRFSTNSIESSGAASGALPLLSIIRPSSYSGSAYTIIASGGSLGSYFSINSSGTALSLGPSGQRSTIVPSTGDYTHYTPTGNGTLALATQINYIPITTISAAYTVLDADNFILSNGSGYNVTLPLASGRLGRRFIFKQASGNIGIVPTGSNTIDDRVYYGLYDYNSVSVISDGNKWWTFNQSPTGLIYGS